MFVAYKDKKKWIKTVRNTVLLKFLTASAVMLLLKETENSRKMRETVLCPCCLHNVIIQELI